MVHGGDLSHKYDLGRKIGSVGDSDKTAQEDILVQVFSRPILREEARRVEPNQHIWPGAPINLLAHSLLIISPSASPDYIAFPLSIDRADRLSAALSRTGLVQFAFQRKGRSDCGSWTTNGEESSNNTGRDAEELAVVSQYINASLQTGCITPADISLVEFCGCLGIGSLLAASTSVGIAFTWPPGSGPRSITLGEVNVTDRVLREQSTALLSGSEVSLFMVHMKSGL
ncbi:uncharacterized protein E0L32_008954 [Thyridium curvatum]|uniref:Uncharacterized protein n=1 Tax=Thyridium curvatum TaxID=1093900 RepID=A0A507AK72_9PEZI|nr:uncharacterized protein E0L32_008954 [Thyridium curvatum]TPX09932.1 hypothetical protein E0L32_008954 [Thyridium curvatum]